MLKQNRYFIVATTFALLLLFFQGCGRPLSQTVPSSSANEVSKTPFPTPIDKSKWNPKLDSGLNQLLEVQKWGAGLPGKLASGVTFLFWK